MNKLVESLKGIFAAHAHELPPMMLWIDEQDRWHELVYCIFSRISLLHESRVREIITAMRELRLLELSDLAEFPLVDGTCDLNDQRCSMIVSTLVQNGFKHENAVLCLNGAVSAAKGLRKVCNGKIQSLIRDRIGGLVDELNSAFDFGGVPDWRKQNIISLWLQNAYTLPVPVSNPYVNQFCEENNVTIDEIVEAADELDINVAVIDDLIRLHMVSEEIRRSVAEAA